MFRDLFTPPIDVTNPGTAVVWWESRRLTYNLIVFSLACISFPIYAVCVFSAGGLLPGEDLIEPLAIPFALVAAPVAVNVGYTLGWLIDFPLRLLFPKLSPRFTSGLFTLGLAFSIFVVTWPAIYWATLRLLQVAKVVGTLRVPYTTNWA